jgi:hypothetical protein
MDPVQIRPERILVRPRPVRRSAADTGQQRATKARAPGEAFMHRTFWQRSLLSALTALLTLSSACTAIEYEDDWMDSPQTEDPSIADPASFLVSERGEPTEGLRAGAGRPGLQRAARRARPLDGRLDRHHR